MQRVNPRDLEKGDVFSEGRSSEKYEVVAYTSINGCAAVIGENVDTGDTHEFGGPLAFREPLYRHDASG